METYFKLTIFDKKYDDSHTFDKKYTSKEEAKAMFERTFKKYQFNGNPRYTCKIEKKTEKE